MSWSVLVGDALERLREMPAESVQCVVTSPPYWGLRDYGTAAWEGGDAGCDHVQPPPSHVRNNGRDRAASGGRFHDSPQVEPALAIPYRGICGKCGAVRQDRQLGLEPTPELYVEHMVEVFREVRRVLRKDGTVWLNLGDSYGGGSGGDTRSGFNARYFGKEYASDKQSETAGQLPQRTRLKPKDLVGIPWRVAFALQADGWWLRSDIIWAKPNPMPESVTDRPTKAHEYVFLLTKSARYFYDADGVREPLTAWEMRDGQMVNTQGGQGFAVTRRPEIYPDRPAMTGNMAPGQHITPNPAGRNLRTVWSIATEPFPQAHFATFPTALVEPCIKAGSRPEDTVLDPFTGSGTVGVVACQLERSFIGIELSPVYAEMAERRIHNEAGLFSVQDSVK